MIKKTGILFLVIFSFSLLSLTACKSLSKEEQFKLNRELSDAVEQKQSLTKIKELLKKGAEINYSHVANVIDDNNLELLKLFHKYGFDLNTIDKSRSLNLLHIASINFKNNNCILYLIESGVDVNYKDMAGKTALMYMLMSENIIDYKKELKEKLPVVKAFIKAGVDLDYKDKQGKSAMTHAKEGNPEIYQYLLDFRKKQAE